MQIRERKAKPFNGAELCSERGFSATCLAFARKRSQHDRPVLLVVQELVHGQQQPADHDRALCGREDGGAEREQAQVALVVGSLVNQVVAGEYDVLRVGSGISPSRHSNK